MIENIIVSIIFGAIIGYFIYRLKRFRDVRNSLKRIQKNNVGRFNLDEEKERNDSQGTDGNSRDAEKSVSSGTNKEKEIERGEKEDGKNREAVGFPKPEERPTNPSDAKQ